MSSDVKWIKITVDMFEDDKIDFISGLPEADAILVVWVRLLTMAGKCNAGGFIMLTESIPYTDEMLANKFKKPLNTVRLALETFTRLGMVFRDENGRIGLSNWDKHQNIDRLEEIRQINAERQKRYRENKKALPSPESNVTQDVTEASRVSVTSRTPSISISNPSSLSLRDKEKEDTDTMKEALRIAALMVSLHRDHWDEKYSPSDKRVRSWAKDIDLLHRIDGRTWEEIELVVRFVKTMPMRNNFTWATNIMSGSKLREKFDTLFPQAKSARSASSRSRQSSLPFQPAPVPELSEEEMQRNREEAARATEGLL